MVPEFSSADARGGNTSIRYPGIGHAILLLVGVVVLSIGLAVPVAILSLVLHLKLVENPAVLGCINLVAFGVVIAIGFLVSRSPLREVFPLRPVPWSLAVPLVSLMIGSSILLSETDNCVRHFLPLPPMLANLFGDLIGAKTGLWGSLFLLAIVAPLTEELLFRGVILHGFLSRYAPFKSVLWSSVLFGLVHLNPWQLITGIWLGVLLGWLRVRTRSLLPCFALHAAFNSLPLCALLLPVTIPGFNTNGGLARTVEFQPLWFNLLGLALFLAGVWLLAARTGRATAETA